jgi:hypothetical protein
MRSLQDDEFRQRAEVAESGGQGSSVLWPSVGAAALGY